MRDPLAAVLLPSDIVDDGVMRVGTVTSTSPVEVMLAGGDGLSAAYLDSYTPTIDDVTLIWQTKGDIIILGLIQPGG